MADAIGLPAVLPSEACLAHSDAPIGGPAEWSVSEASSQDEHIPGKGSNDAPQQVGFASEMRPDPEAPQPWNPPFQPLLAVGLPPPSQVLVHGLDGVAWPSAGYAAPPAAVRPALLGDDEARAAELQKGAEILAFSQRLGLLDLHLPEVPVPEGPIFVATEPLLAHGGSDQSGGGELPDLTDLERGHSQGSAPLEDGAPGQHAAGTEGLDLEGGTQEGPSPVASPQGSPEVPFPEPVYVAATERLPHAGVRPAAPSAEAVLASPPNCVVPELDVARRLGRGELAAEERVPIWNRAAQRKLTGRCGPMRKNLKAYLEKHPECEIYDRQQAGQPPPPQAAPTKRRPVQIADRSGGQKRGAVQAAVEAPSTFVPAKRRAALREGYYRALQDGKVAGASDWGEQARHEDEGGLRTGGPSGTLPASHGPDPRALSPRSEAPPRGDLAGAAYGRPRSSVSDRVERDSARDGARLEPEASPPKSREITPPGGGGKRKKMSTQQTAALQALADSAGWNSLNIEARAATARLCAQFGMTLGQVKKWFSNHRPRDLPSPVTPRTPLDAHWSRPEDVPQPPRHGPSPTRSATPPPVSSRAGSRSPSPVLHALLPSAACQGPASASLQDPPARVPSPPPAPLRARSLGLGFSLSGSLGRSPQALAEVPSSGSLQTPLFASPALPPSPGLRGSLHGPLPLDFLSRESPHDLLGAHLSLGPPTDEALLVAAPLHAQPSHAPVPNQPLAAATPYHGMGPEVSAPLFGRAADARLEEGDQRAEAEGRNEEEWRQQERTARRTEEGWQGEVVGGADERDGGGRIPSSAGQTKAGAHKRGGSFGGFDLESNDASELDALMECEEEPEQRKATPEIEYGRHDRPGHQDEERAGAIARSFQQAFTDRTVRMASLDTGRDASRGWRSMREESAGEDTWQPGARDEARDRIKLTSYRMELRRDVRARLPPGRSPSPYSLRMSTLQRTRPPAREQQPGGAARADRHEEQHGGARPARQDSPGRPPGADLPAMLRSTGFRGSGPRSRVQAVLFEKALTLSDTSHLGRIVLPKGCAEKYLPPMDEKEGRPIVIEDNYGARWCFRYRFWPNNKSKMYVLEHSGDFLRAHRLRVGDVVQFCRSELGHLIVQGKKEAARQAAGLAPGGRSPRGAPLRPQRELRPPTHKRSPATSRPRRRGARGPLIPPPGVASFDAVRARAREVSMTSEELLRSSREIRAEMRASVARNEARGAYSAPVDGFAEVEEQQFQTDSQTEQQQRGSQEEEERHVLGAAGTTGLYDSRAGFSPPRPPSVPPLTGEGPFRLASLYPAHLYSELARGSPPGPVFQPIPRPTPHYLAPPWTGALQASLFPWAAPFAGTPGFGLEAGPSALMGAGLPLGGFNLEVPPPDVPQAGSPELDERETPTMGEIQGGRWQQPINAEGMSGQEGGASAKFSGREWAAGDSKDVAGNGQQLGCGDTFPMLGRGLDEARHRESGSPEAEANAGQGDAATGGLQAMPRVAGMDAVEHSLALLSGRGGGETAEREDGQGGAQGGTADSSPDTSANTESAG